MVLFISNKC